MKNNKMVKLTVIIVSVLVVAVLAVLLIINISNANNTEVEIKGTTVNFPVPKGTQQEEYGGLGVAKFKSTSDKTATKSFYDDYYKTLIKCNYKDEQNRYVYLDKSKKMCFSTPNIWEVDGNTYFLIDYSKCDDIAKSEEFEISK